MHTSHLSPELDTSFEMKSLLFLLALGYVSSDKLDLSYLPPPGSQYAGGRPGDIQIPLEFPKETYSTTFRPQLGDNRGLSPEDYKATIGIDRVPGVQDVGSVPFVPNTNRVPTTTVSYAFTQTTTHPPNEGFETTLSPLVNEGFPTTDLFNIPSQEPSLTYDGNLNLQKLPGYQQTVNQFGQPSLATTPATFNNIPSQLPGSTYGGNFNQFGQPILTPTSVPVTQYTGSLNQRVPTGAQFVGQDQSGYKQSVFPNQFKNQSYIGGLGSVNQPGFVSSTVLPQGFPTTARPVTTIGNNIYNVPSILPNNVQSGIPEEGVQINGKPLGNQKLNEQPGLQQFLDRPTVSQTLPGSQILNQLNGPSKTAGPAFAPNAQQNVYQPSSTIAPTYSPGILNQDYPAGTAIIPGQSGQQFATVSPNPGTQANAISSVYRQRPERPQAEGDRNAVILNYENVITPEGFSYSFDTSNGIHADESGTATDGVKAKGSYSYVGDDGKLYSVVYTADENGFRPQGDHLPTPPPVPEAIQRVIDQAERDREAGISDDGSYNEDKYGHKKYQGTMNRRPSFTNGAVIPKSDVTNTRVKQIKQKTRPQIGEQRPDMALDEAYYADNNQKFVDKNERRRPISASTKRPLSPITDINEEDIEGGDLEGVLGEDQTIYSQSTSGPYVDITSKRPVNQAVRKQYNNNISPDAAETYIKNEDRRRPNADVPYVSNENQNQDSVQYSEYKMPQNKGDNNYNFETKESFERPLDYENGEISETSKPFKQTEGQKVLDKFGRPVIKNPSRRPVSSADRFEKYPSTEEQYKNQQSNRRPSNKVTSSVIDNLQNQNDDYSSEEDSVPFSPTRLRPGNVKIPNKFVKQDQYATIGKRRRPARPGLQVYKDAEGNIQYQSEGDKDYEESEDTSDYNRGTPSGSFTDSYEEIDQETDGFYSNTGFVSGRPKNTFKKKQGRPQGTKNIIKDERLQGSLDNQYKTNIPGKNGQKLAPPPYGKQSGLIDGDYGPNGSGYQYYPPQTKFEQDEVKTFPNGVTGSTRPLAERPTPSTNNYESKYEDVTRIFMTPNVPQTKVGINGDQFQASTPGAPNKFDVQNYFQYPVDGYTSEETFEDELTNGPINKVISSTKRPSQGTQKDKPLQGHDSRYVQSTKRPGFVSSTTPLPSSRPYTGTRPTSPYLDQRYTTGGEPGQTFVSSTTPLPSQSPIDDFSQQGTIKPQYQTTYGPPETFGPTSAYKNRTKIQRLPSAVQYQENLPSTTYRPSYTTYGPSRSSSATAPPNIQVDRYGRPISKPGFGSTSQEYLPGPTQPSSTMRPEQRVDVYGKPVQLEYGTTAQEYIPGDQNEPSSTALPEVLVDTFGRPIRPGQGVTNQELAATKPGSSADAFGRPIKPGQRQQFIPGGQIQPSTTAQPGLSIDAYGRPTPESSSIDNTPGYTTPSGIIQSGDRLVGQYQPGVVPTVQDYIQGSVNEQIRPTSVTVSPGSQFRGNQRYQTGGLRNQPSVSQSVSTFQPSTERVVGEDFSGPKQQQRFDPERGYYY